MKNRSRLKRMTIAVSMILLVLIIGLTFGGRERVTKFENLLGNIFIPVQRGFNAVANGVEAVVHPIFDIWENEHLVLELEEENQSLKQELVELTLSSTEYAELKMLQKVFEFTDKVDRKHMIEARVVSKDPGNWYNMSTINRGLVNGITKNSAVINGEGLIGLAYEVGDDWSKVISIIDNKSSIGFRILDDERLYEGVISGGIDGQLKGMLFDPQAKVEEGDILITSGKGLYPEGIIIGEVTETFHDADALLMEVDIDPSVNFRNLDRVLVIPYLNLQGDDN